MMVHVLHNQRQQKLQVILKTLQLIKFTYITSTLKHGAFICIYFQSVMICKNIVVEIKKVDLYQ